MIARIRRLFRPLSTPRVLTSTAAYAQWAAAYPPHAHNPLMEIEQQAMLSLFPDLTGHAVLDLACGTGRYGLLALERGAAWVIGLDNSSAMLARNALTLTALATTESIPLAGATIDTVVCAMALGHLPSLEPSLAEISRVLKPGGYALVSDFHPIVALSGGQRTFTAPNGKVYAVEHYVHLYADYHQAAQQSGLIIESVLEPISPYDAKPVVIAFRFYKP